MLDGKKGLFDIEDFFAVFVYTLILFMFLIILSLPNCMGDRKLSGLAGESQSIDKLNYGQEIVEMLKTKLPDDLPSLIERQKDTKFGSLSLYRDLDYKAAEQDLTGNKRLYESQTYSEFIDNLQFMVTDKNARNNIFAVVTRAVFVKELYPPHAIELRPDLKRVLVYPEVYVKYGVAGLFDRDFDADLSNHLLLPPYYKGEVFAVIPLTNSAISPKTATVLLMIRPGINE